MCDSRLVGSGCIMLLNEKGKRPAARWERGKKERRKEGKKGKEYKHMDGKRREYVYGIRTLDASRFNPNEHLSTAPKSSVGFCLFVSTTVVQRIGFQTAHHFY